MSARWSRIVFHVDMDAFYASIEQRDDPSLRGKPVIVGGTGRRGVVSTASYEAREFGVHSAMPMFQARERCPDGIFVPGRMSVYVEASRRLMDILGRYSPDVEPLSLDEAFIEMTGTESLLGPPHEVAARLLDDVEHEIGVTASVGVASAKYIAKVASDLDKPRGLTVCPPGQEKEFLAPLSIRKLWGIGPKTEPRLNVLGLRTIGDVAKRSKEELEAQLGSLGDHIWRLANGEDARPVRRRERAKSMGAERTLSTNIRGAAPVRAVLLPLCDEVAARLRKAELRAHGVRLKVKYADFKSHTRQLKLHEGVQDSASLMHALEELFEKIDLSRSMRLVGMAAFSMQPAGEALQQGLFTQQAEVAVVEEKDEALAEKRSQRARQEQLENALDGVRKKFGDDAIGRASGRSVAAMTPSDHYRS